MSLLFRSFVMATSAALLLAVSARAQSEFPPLPQLRPAPPAAGDEDRSDAIISTSLAIPCFHLKVILHCLLILML